MKLFARRHLTDDNKNRFSIPIRDENKLVLTLIGLASGLFLLIFVMLFLVANNRVLATRGKVYVQLPEEGTTKEAQEFDADHRENGVLQGTVIDFIRLTFEWDNKLPGTDRLDEKGTRISGSSEVVPTKAYLASYLLEDGFRTEFLKELSKLVPKDVYSGGRTAVVRIYSISTPRQISRSRWEVDTVVSRIEKGQGSIGDKREVRFNRTYTLQAIVPDELVLAEDEPDLFRRQVNELLKNGTMITNIVPFNP